MKFERLKNNRKLLLFTVAFVLVGVTLILNITKAKYRTTQSINIAKGKINYELGDQNLMGIYVQEGEDYTQTSTVPETGYKFNSEKSYCKKGDTKLDTTITYNLTTKTLGITPLTEKGTKCYLYFDEQGFEITLDNYTLSWEPVSGVDSYNIYSNGELLTTTTENSVELYKYYEEPGTYNITARTVTGETLGEETESISYSVEQLLDGKYIIAYAIVGVMHYDGDYYDVPLSSIAKNYLSGGMESAAKVYVCDTINTDGTPSSDCVNTLDVEIDTNITEINICSTSISYVDPSSYFHEAYTYNYSEEECFSGTFDEYSNYLSINDFRLFRLNYLNNGSISFRFSEYQTDYFKVIFSSPGYIDSEYFYGAGSMYCVTGDTTVYIYDRKKRRFKKKKIKDVDYDDELLVWDFDNGCFTTAKPLWIMKKQTSDKHNIIKFSDGSILKTLQAEKGHRIFNKEKGMFTYPMTSDTPIGTTTINSKGEEVTLVSKEIVYEQVDYYNIMTNYHINLFTNGILTSSRLSNIYPIKDMKYVKDNRELKTKEDYPNISEKWFEGLRLAEQPVEIDRNGATEFKTIEKYVKHLEEIERQG